MIKNNIMDSKVEFSTFLVGCRIPAEIIRKQDYLYSNWIMNQKVLKKKLTERLVNFYAWKWVMKLTLIIQI